MGLLILYFFTAIGVSFLCSILESILLSLSFSYISVLEKENPKAGSNLKTIKQDINKSIASILILNTIANTLGAAGVGAQAAKVFGDDIVFLASALLTFIILFFSEIIPKTIGAMYWRELAPIAGYIIKFFIFITYPIIIVTQFVTNKISKNNKDTNTLSREELLESTLLSENKGIIDEIESDVIENILNLDDIKLNFILTPRSVVFAIDKNSLIEDAIQNDELYRFSRIPVYEDSIDNIIGIVLTKKIFEAAIHKKYTKIEDIVSEVFKINEKVPVSKALDLFIKRREHMFIVVDKYDQTEGIVTLEDCIETLLGVEIMDEFDTTENMQDLAKQKMKEKRLKKKEKKEKKKREKVEKGFVSNGEIQQKIAM